ncbi:MAG: hypothetical protein ABNH38_00175 [Tateyamaria sp.]|jgi:ABC-type nickel/cobalt efflux system permease component RcnA|uniref:nickel/cobalt transporter n=2 Tax=Tateyamaria sp. TaxID=1929288 RepID=UPI0032DD9E27
MRVALFLIATVSVALFAINLVDLGRIALWAMEAQRGFQNQMAGAIRALKAGEVGAYAALLSATAAYGFVHALGPGHGKYLVGGVGLGTSVSARKLIGLATASSLAQSLWAIVLVFGGFSLVEVSARQLTVLAEEYLAPISYLAIAGVGLLLVWRGLKAVKRLDRLRQDQHQPQRVLPAGEFSFARQHALAHADGITERSIEWADRSASAGQIPCDENCDCAAHGPTLDQVARVGSVRDALGLVLSIAIRPCTGAIFLLVIAWQMGLAMAGAIAVVTMGLGTAALTSLVAVSSVVARNTAALSIENHRRWGFVMPSIQVFSGATIALVSLSLLGFRVAL